MTANPYTHLGWNPVPGIPSEVQELKTKVERAAKALRESHRQINQLLGESSHWEGDAASAFHDALDGELPKYMKKAAESVEEAALQLGKWDGDLTANRDLAKKYDDEAKEKKEAADGAQTRYDGAKKDPALDLAGKQFPSQAEADAATDRLRAAESRLNAASTSLTNANDAYNDVIKKAKELDKEHEREANKVAGELDKADDDLAPQEPGWLESTISSIGNALKEAGQWLLDHAGTIGAIAGLLALLPTPLAPLFAGIAIVASAASMAKNLASEDFRDALAGEHGWKAGLTAGASLAGDLLGVVPGVGALARAGGEVGMLGALARESGEVMSAGSKITNFGSETVRAISESVPATPKVLDYALNGANVVANTASSLETEGVLPDSGISHDATEASKAGIAGAGAPSALSNLASDFGDLMTGIRL